ESSKESIVNMEGEEWEREEIKELYVTISPKGDFVVELVLLKNGSNESKFESKFKLRMFNVCKKLNENDHSDLEYNDELSNTKLSYITSKTLKFAKEQSELITLLAISCIIFHDMTRNKHIEGTKIPGFTIIFSINKDFSIEKEMSINDYGGIIKLFSKNEDNEKKDKDDQNTDRIMKVTKV
ncbi:22750_t:CDS:2, partial [Dentiscutata erythropus]